MHSHDCSQVMNARELSLVSSYMLGNGKALVIAANKMDALPGKEEQKAYMDTLHGCLVCVFCVFSAKFLPHCICPALSLVACFNQYFQRGS